MSYEIDSLVKAISVQVKRNIYLTHAPVADEDTHQKYMVEIVTENSEINSVQWFAEFGTDHYHPTTEPLWFSMTHTYQELLKDSEENG